MVRRSRIAARAAALALTLAVAGSASAQFGSAFPGIVRLPSNDFTWIWGDFDERDLRRRADFVAKGTEEAFICEVNGMLRPSSRLERTDIRQIETTLNTSLFFIQESAQMLSVLDQSRDLDWGRLICTLREVEPDAEREQEKVDRALERAQRQRERRRAREDDD